MFETKADVNYSSARTTKGRLIMPLHIPLRTERLKKMRVERRKTQQYMATKLGVSQSQYADWERGRNSPRAEVVAHIGAILDVTTDFLYGLVDQPDETLKEEGLTEQEILIIRELRKDEIKRFYVLKLLDLPASPPALKSPDESDDQSQVSS